MISCLSRLAVAFAFFVASLMPLAASAATATAPFTVTATVLSVCIISATNLIFGNYTSSSATPLAATSTVLVTCTFGTNYTVGLNAGTGSSATVAARSMTNGSSSLSYNMYTNTSHTTIWGDGTLSTSTNSGTAGLTPTPYTVYGLIPVSQYVTPGSYTDTVTATVSY